MPLLAQQHTVIAADLPGSGDSTPQPGAYDKKSLAETLYGAMVSLGYTQIAVAGHDIGGVVAYAYAALHPEGVTRLSIMDVPFPSPDIYTFPALTSEGAGSFWYVGFLNVPQLPEQLITGHERDFIQYFVLHLAAHPEVFPPQELAIITKQFARPGRKHAAFEYYRALHQDVIDFQAWSQTKLSLPVLAVGGERSFGASEVTLVQAYAENVAGVVVPDSGHWVAEEQPVFLAQALNKFFADHAQSTR
jgi:pimeloyl-ACP methyl ester carboxylesterase